MNTLLTTLCSHLHLKPEHTALLDERDTSDVWRQFAIWVLVGPHDGVIRLTRRGSLQYNAIQRVANLYIQDCKDVDAWKEAYDAATYAAYADTAWYALSAAYAACSAAWYAARAADAGNYVSDVTDSEVAESAHYERMADKLIELLQAAPLMK